jgi:hypothetical protein
MKKRSRPSSQSLVAVGKMIRAMGHALCATWSVVRETRGFGFFHAVSIALAFLCFSQICMADAPTMKTLSAHVVKVSQDSSSVDVDFRHPATGEIQHLTFHVDNQTGLSGFDNLQELRAGQVVNLDYVEGEKHRLLIRRIARVKLSGPPAGLENFRGL